MPMSEGLNELTATQILNRVLEIAEEKADNSLKKWAYLELEGYYASNKYLTEDDIVPEYREVAGEHRDIYGRPLLLKEPKLQIVNTYRLRHSAPELEGLAKSDSALLIIRDPETNRIIEENLGVTVHQFVFSRTSVDSILSSIKQEAARRTQNYVKRRDLMSGRIKDEDSKRVFPQEITLSWLWGNVPVRLWAAFFGLLFGAFSIGLYVSGIPEVKAIMRYIPGYNTNMILPEKTAKNVENQIDKLIDSHNARLAELQKQLLYEEKLAADHSILYSDSRKEHERAAQRIREMIREENQNFQNELGALKSFLQ